MSADIEGAATWKFLTALFLDSCMGWFGGGYLIALAGAGRAALLISVVSVHVRQAAVPHALQSRILRVKSAWYSRNLSSQLIRASRTFSALTRLLSETFTSNFIEVIVSRIKRPHTSPPRAMAMSSTASAVCCVTGSMA
jgi:hypothetical protein